MGSPIEASTVRQHVRADHLLHFKILENPLIASVLADRFSVKGGGYIPFTDWDTPRDYMRRLRYYGHAIAIALFFSIIGRIVAGTGGINWAWAEIVCGGIGFAWLSLSYFVRHIDVNQKFWMCRMLVRRWGYIEWAIRAFHRFWHGQLVWLPASHNCEHIAATRHARQFIVLSRAAILFPVTTWAFIFAVWLSLSLRALGFAIQSPSITHGASLAVIVVLPLGYGISSFMVWRSVRRVQLRSRKDECASCGYHLGDSSVLRRSLCPECGQRIY